MCSSPLLLQTNRYILKSFENKDKISFGLMGAASVTQAG